MKWKKMTAAVLSAVMMITMLPYAAASQFKDIAGHWAKEDIEYAVQKGWFNGVSATSFQPNGTMTRGMFVKALGELSHADMSQYSGSTKFKDVSSSAYYARYVSWANQNGIVNGVSADRFSPNTAITREQIAVMMVKYANYVQMILPRKQEWHEFSDINACADYSLDAIFTLYRAGVLNGMGNDTIAPRASATRAQCTAIFRRLYDTLNAGATKQQQVLLVNHRGYNSEAGENTMAAYRLSHAYGFEYCETDIYFTKDGVPVLIHDPSINRTSNGTGSVSQMTYAQMKQYDYSCGHAGTDGSLATFDEFMKYCSENNMHPYAELKNNVNRAQAEQLVAIARKYNMLDNMIWISFYNESLKNISAVVPNATLGYLSSKATDAKIKTALALRNGQNTVMFHVKYVELTAEQQAKLIRNHLPFVVWTVDDVQRCIKYANSSAISITTDNVKPSWLYAS